MARSNNDDPKRTPIGEDGFSGETPDAVSPKDDPLHEMALEAGIEFAASPSVQEETDWLALGRAAIDAGVAFHDEKLRTNWSRALRAFNSEHMRGSKYSNWRYKTRSKLFKPKTRMAVRKNAATTASALFSTEDVVTISAENAQDRKSRATARFIHAALNYRMDRVNRWAGPNWFMVATGARQDTQIHGVCISKQYWEYREKLEEEEVEQEIIGPDGMPVIDDTGTPVKEMRMRLNTIPVRDRLMVELIPPEHALMDPAADWTDPIQDGGFFVAKHPVRIDDLEDMILNGGDTSEMGGPRWRDDIDIEKLHEGHSEDDQAVSVRRARSNATDRYEDRFTDRDSKTVWLHECFYRIGGQDWHWWMIGTTIMLSDPVPVEEAYPEQLGERPYVRGVGELETHTVYPTSPVMSWQGMQQEINDLTNLHLDALKTMISPTTKIVRGKQIDLKQVQNRGPDQAIMVSAPDDVTIEKAPTPTQTYQDVNQILADFDELAGVFSGSSVNTNRSLNETVGGMKMLSASAGSLTEFDLRVFVETWVEPVLRQCVRLIQYYEADKRVMLIAGSQAGLLPQAKKMPNEKGEMKDGAEEQGTFMRIGLNDIIDRLSAEQLIVRVNVGIGAVTAREKLEKLSAAVGMTMKLLPLFQQQGYELQADEIATEIWGLNGYKDVNRFFKKINQQQKGPSEEQQKTQAEMAKEKLKAKVNAEKSKFEAAQEDKDRALRAHEIDIQKNLELLKLIQNQQSLNQVDGPDGLEQFQNPQPPQQPGPPQGGQPGPRPPGPPQGRPAAPQPAGAGPMGARPPIPGAR